MPVNTSNLNAVCSGVDLLMEDIRYTGCLFYLVLSICSTLGSCAADSDFFSSVLYIYQKNILSSVILLHLINVKTYQLADLEAV